MDFPYDLDNPIEQYELPDKYVEISGIYPVQGDSCLAFVQDEAIRIYLLDLTSREISKYNKHKPGDSEDIVIIANSAYILHAGEQPSLYRINNYNSESAKYQYFDLNLNKHYDPEGLCHDAKGNRLLIACKGSPNKGDTLRNIFSFDLQSETRSSLPVFTIDSREFLKKSKDRFNPSGIAIHPKTSDIYLVGTRGVKMIVCYSFNGTFKGSWTLDKKVFIQPEGIKN